MNHTTNNSRILNPIVRVLRDHPKRWLVPAVVATALAGVYALVRPATWEAAQALIVRNEATSSQDAPGRFAQPDEMKTVQETILELVKSRGVLSAALAKVEQPSPQPSPTGRGDEARLSPTGKGDNAEPTAEAIADLRDALKLAPPKGAEFGKTEVFYLKVRDGDRRRAIALADAICSQLETAIENVRDAKAQSMVRELQKAVELAETDLAQSTAKLSTIEREVGNDLGELRLLCESNPGESVLHRTAAEIRTELRQVRAALESNRQLLALLAQAQSEPERLVATPNTLLDSQPALKKLKEGLIEAQLNTAQTLGRMSDVHPLVLAAKESQAEIRNRLHEELANAVRALEVDLRLGADKAATLDGQLASLGARLDVLAARRAPYANQLAQTRKCSEMLDRAQQRLSDARASHATAGTTSLISTIDSPDAGTRPLGPSRAAIVVLGLVGGLLAGFGVVLLTVNPAEGNDRQTQVAAEPKREVNHVPTHRNASRHAACTTRRPSVEESLMALAVGGRRGTNW
jgi:polysaccharide biosynthesis transport protein